MSDDPFEREPGESAAAYARRMRDLIGDIVGIVHFEAGLVIDVDSGEYPSASEMVIDALRMMRRDRGCDAAQFEELRHAIEIGMHQAKRSENPLERWQKSRPVYWPTAMNESAGMPQ